jgi:hypothetical protein
MAKTIGQLTQATTLASGDEFIIEQSGLTKRVAASVVRGGLVNADVDAAAAIAFSKLAALDSANLLVGNGSNVATKVAVTGDVTISNAGVTAIGSAKVTPTMLTQPLTLATSQATTSGTSIDFTGIPSWAKRITVMFDGVSTNGTSPVSLQLGDSGGVETAGYSGFGTMIAGSGTAANIVASTANTVGFNLSSSSLASDSTIGIATILNFSGNTWAFASNVQRQTSTTSVGNGSKTLSATLDRIRLTTVNGTDTFDAGSINIMYEG